MLLQKCDLVIKNMWNEDLLIPKQRMFFGKPFTTQKRAKQGDILLPALFNIIIDANVRHSVDYI